MKTIRVGFVGLGGICRQRHVPGLRRIEGVEIVAVANRSRASSEAAARELGIPEVCDSWRELVARDDLDAVFIGTWPYMHREVTLAALDAGKSVFCQARMALDFQEAREMYNRARGSGRVAMLCPVPFGLSVDATIARFIREGRLGEVRLVRAQSLSDAYLRANVPLNWRKDRRLSGLNTLTLGMYIEVMHRWFGWTRSVSALTQIYIPERTGAHGNRVKVEVPDQIVFNTEMAGGFPVQYVISGCVPFGTDAIDIYGTQAMLHYDVDADRLQIATGKGNSQPVAILPEDAYDVNTWRVERDFIDAIREGKDYHPNFEDGMRYMQVIQGVFDSAANRRTIDLDTLAT
jgi:predicted dehydrogenase